MFGRRIVTSSSFGRLFKRPDAQHSSLSQDTRQEGNTLPMSTGPTMSFAERDYRAPSATPRACQLPGQILELRQDTYNNHVVAVHFVQQMPFVNI